MRTLNVNGLVFSVVPSPDSCRLVMEKQLSRKAGYHMHVILAQKDNESRWLCYMNVFSGVESAEGLLSVMNVISGETRQEALSRAIRLTENTLRISGFGHIVDRDGGR